MKWMLIVVIAWVSDPLPGKVGQAPTVFQVPVATEALCKRAAKQVGKELTTRFYPGSRGDDPKYDKPGMERHRPLRPSEGVQLASPGVSTTCLKVAN